MQFSISNIWISYRGKICFSRMLKNSSRTQNVRDAASTNGKWKNFWKSVSFSHCVWFHLYLAFRQRLFLKLIWKYWYSRLDLFSTLTSPWQTIFDAQKKLHSYQIYFSCYCNPAYKAVIWEFKMTVVKFNLR